MSGFFNAIGLVSGALTIVSFTESQLPDNKPQGPSIRIKAGLHGVGEESESLGGSIAAVYAWGEGNRFSGQAGGCGIDPGSFCDVTVDQGSGRRAEYIGVSNNDDATCIAWISVNQADDTDGGAWTGDIGRHCGERWYNSRESAGNLKDSSKPYVPACTWLDKDETNDIVNAALKFTTNAYASSVQEVADEEKTCDSTIYGGDSGPIAPQPAKRSIPERPKWMHEYLIVSNWTSQTAADLCNSATSWGPDFIGSDDQFCDMSTKTLTPLCSPETVGSSGCVDVDEDAVSVVKRTSVARRAATVLHKSYKKIEKWGV
ncbi:uncharacterized protein J4E84_010053 [Alternaria hordeiaustralica]|uniref:uncharacterized protein n=1 Tax=Alternaria hordeiaustralica TaxID=1187925 RepID=UPI0020C45EB1|nr:uncharacterized protein J4E84_010053 [Alternaria hordeiaustralica]KAI4675458.1 hypothetical protein J4E84_010053 [Alternaria hordeiaustralica]